MALLAVLEQKLKNHSQYALFKIACFCIRSLLVGKHFQAFFSCSIQRGEINLRSLKTFKYHLFNCDQINILWILVTLLEKQKLNLLRGTIVSEANFSWDSKLLVQGIHISKCNCDWRENSSWAYLVVSTLWSVVPQAVCRLALKRFLSGEKKNLVGLNSLWMSFTSALQIPIRGWNSLVKKLSQRSVQQQGVQPAGVHLLTHQTQQGLISKVSKRGAGLSCVGPAPLLPCQGSSASVPSSAHYLLLISCSQTPSLCWTGCFRTAFPPLPSPISSTQTFDIHLCIKESLFSFLACFHLSAQRDGRRC